MGVLIKGDPRQERLYTMKEISQASGIKVPTLQRRRMAMGMPASEGGYTYEQALQLIRRPLLRKQTKPENVARLRRQLEKDGML